MISPFALYVCAFALALAIAIHRKQTTANLHMHAQLSNAHSRTHTRMLAHANTCTNDIQTQNFSELSPNNNTCVDNAVRLFQMRASSAIFAQPLCKQTGGRVQVSVQHVYICMCVSANVFGPIAYCRSQCAKVFSLFVCCAPALGCTKKSPFVNKPRIWRVPETLAIPEAFFMCHRCTYIWYSHWVQCP